MKLPPGPFRITISGDTNDALASPRSQTILGHLFHRLIMGMEVEEAELEAWGLRIEVDD